MLFCVGPCSKVSVVRQNWRASLLIALSCALLGSGCDRNVKNLGGGFTVVHQPPADTSASKRHSDHHLYFGAKDLGTVAVCFISPSTCYAIYDHEGKLMLFHSCSERTKTIADLGGASPSSITSSEARNDA